MTIFLCRKSLDYRILVDECSKIFSPLRYKVADRPRIAAAVQLHRERDEDPAGAQQSADPAARGATSGSRGGRGGRVAHGSGRVGGGGDGGGGGRGGGAGAGLHFWD